MCSKLLKLSVLALSISSSLSLVHGGEAQRVVNAGPDAAEPLYAEDGPQMMGLYYDYLSEVDFEDESGGYSLNAVRFQSPLAGKMKGGFAWGVDAFVEYTSFDVKDQPELEDMDLYRVGLDLNFIWLDVNGSKWSPMLRLSPSIASDFDSISSDDLRLTATAGAFYQQKPNLKWLFGVFYTNNYYGDKWNNFFMIPIVGISWQPTEHFDITALGSRIDFSYLPNDDWKFSLFAAARSRNWNIDGDTGSESFEVTSMRTGVRVDHQLVEDCWVIFETGVTMFNGVSKYDDHDKELYDEDADPGFFVGVGLRYRF